MATANTPTASWTGLLEDVLMVLDNTTPNEDSMDSGEGEQASASPQDVDPKRMDKLHRYLLRRGMYASVYPEVLYRVLLVMREYNSTSDGQVDKPFIVKSGLIWWFPPFKIALTINKGEASLSIPLWRWVRRIYGKEAITLRSLGSAQKREMLGLLALFSITMNFFVILTSFPRYMISGLVGNLSATIRAARSVPALIAILIVVFITDDAWRIFGLESTLRLSIMIIMLVALSVLVLVTGLRRWMAEDRHLGAC